MADVFVSKIEVPRIPRNKRIYGGNSFNTSNKYEQSIAGGGITVHRELGIITDLPTNYPTGEVDISFGTAFIKTPVGFDNLKVYRMEAMGGGYNSQDVLHTFPTAEPASLTGFTLNIHSSESLTGVIIEYKFEE